MAWLGVHAGWGACTASMTTCHTSLARMGLSTAVCCPAMHAPRGLTRLCVRPPSVSAEGEGPAYVLEMLKELNTRTCAGKCAVGSGGKSVG